MVRQLRKSPDKIIIIIYFLILTILRFTSLTSLGLELSFDEGSYLFVGYQLDSGSQLYIDIIDIKPPLMFFLFFALELVGMSSILIIRVIGVLITIIISYTIYLIAKILFDERIGFWSGFLYCFWSSIDVIESRFFLQETPMNFFGVIGIFLFLKHEKKTEFNEKKKSNLFLSGMFVGISFLFKQPGGFFLIVILMILFTSKKQDFKNKIKSLFLVFCGFSIFFPGFLIIFLNSPDLLTRIIHAIIPINFNQGDFYTQRVSVIAAIYLMIKTVNIYSFVIGLLLVGNLIQPIKSTDRKSLFLLVFWLIANLIVILLLPTFAPHYLLQTLIPFSIIGGRGLNILAVECYHSLNSGKRKIFDSEKMENLQAEINSRNFKELSLNLFMIFIIVFHLFALCNNLQPDISKILNNEESVLEQTALWLNDNLRKEDRVFLIKSNPVIYKMINRYSPTKYPYLTLDIQSILSKEDKKEIVSVIEINVSYIVIGSGMNGYYVDQIPFFLKNTITNSFYLNTEFQDRDIRTWPNKYFILKRII